MKKITVIMALIMRMIILPFMVFSASRHKYVTLKLYTMTSVGVAYTFGFALSQLINRHSKWL